MSELRNAIKSWPLHTNNDAEGEQSNNEAAIGRQVQQHLPQHEELQQEHPQAQRQQQEVESEQIDEDKRVIYRHPLFPLLALMFEKCELATQSPSSSSMSSALRSDLEVFFAQKHSKGEPITLPDNHEANELMVKALQVLRIHLLELEKVHELCMDFCNRYITCLKTKMHSENLIRSDGNSSNVVDDSDDSDSLNNATRDRQSVGMQQQPHVSANESMSSLSTELDDRSSSRSVHDSIQVDSSMVVGNNAGSELQQGFQSSSNSGSLGNQNFFPTPEGLMAADGAITRHQPLPLNQQEHKLQHIAAAIFGDDFDDTVNSECSESSKKKTRRKLKKNSPVLPRHATGVMKAWLFQHIMHPYPTEAQKAELSDQTQLTPAQINNWFINARRRILQPLMELRSEPSMNDFNNSLARNFQLNQSGHNEVSNNAIASTTGMVAFPLQGGNNDYDGISNGS